MPRATFTVSIPVETWIHAVSTAHPNAVFRVTSLLSAADSAVAVVELHADEPVAVLGAVDGRPDVHALDLLWSRGEEALLQIEVDDPSLLDPLRRAGVSLETPFEVQDGVAVWELTTSSSRLSVLGRQFEAAGIAYELTRVAEVDESPAAGLLTDRQLEVMRAAFEAGYYDVPRGATLTEVAESLAVSKATVSDVLHRAEGHVVRQFLDIVDD